MKRFRLTACSVSKYTQRCRGTVYVCVHLGVMSITTTTTFVPYRQRTSAYRYQLACTSASDPKQHLFVRSLSCPLTEIKHFCLPDKFDTNELGFIAYNYSTCTSYNPLCFHLDSSLCSTCLLSSPIPPSVKHLSFRLFYSSSWLSFPLLSLSPPHLVLATLYELISV